MRSGDVIGVSSWSATLLAMVDAMHPVAGVRGTQVVQILGGGGDPAAEGHATHLVRRMAHLLHGEGTFLPAPSSVGSQGVAGRAPGGSLRAARHGALRRPRRGPRGHRRPGALRPPRQQRQRLLARGAADRSRRRRHRRHRPALPARGRRTGALIPGRARHRHRARAAQARAARHRRGRRARQDDGHPGGPAGWLDQLPHHGPVHRRAPARAEPPGRLVRPADRRGQPVQPVARSVTNSQERIVA